MFSQVKPMVAYLCDAWSAKGGSDSERNFKKVLALALDNG